MGKRLWRRFLAGLLTLSLVFVLLPAVPIRVEAASGNGIVDKLDQLRNNYPSGKYW